MPVAAAKTLRGGHVMKDQGDQRGLVVGIGGRQQRLADPAKPPQTWKQVEDYSKKLIASGAAKCGLSTGWPSWTMVENPPW